MTLFNHNYPYTDFHEINLDWVIKTINDMDVKIKDLETSVFEMAKKYIDEQILQYAEDVTRLRNDFESFKNGIDADISNFESVINAQITVMNGRIDAFGRSIDEKIDIVNARTDLAIQQNNNYIFSQIGEYLQDNVKILNGFTGEYVSIQEMIDYLGGFHTAGAIIVSDLISRQKTVNQLITLDLNVTDIIINGNTLIV